MGAGVGSDGLMYPLDVAYLNQCGIKTDARSVEQLVAFTMDLDEEIKILSESIKQK